MQINKSELLTRKQLTEIFQVSLSTVIRWQESGKLQVVRLGAGSSRYRKADVESFIAKASA